MNDTETTYLFHQTPKHLAKDLIQFVPLVEGDKVLEPFKGEGAFYDVIPNFCVKSWAEIRQGRDYTDASDDQDWVVTNPPFRLEGNTGRVNAFWYLLDYYTQRVKKGVAFLANDNCFSTLTPKRMKLLQDRGFAITKVVICSVKKWRGRYFFVILQKNGTGLVSFLPNNY